MNNELRKLSLFLVNVHSLRFRHTKHWNPKFKKERKAKVEQNVFSNSEYTDKLNRLTLMSFGVYPRAPWVEEPIYIGCTGSIFEPYEPPDGDGKFSSISILPKKQGEYLVNKTKTYRAITKIKSLEEGFNINQFANEALDLYNKAHEALARKDYTELKSYVTEQLLPEMLFNVENKIIRWKFVKSLEPPKVVHSRCTSMLSEDNLYAQLTVRLHTEQILAMYDRFGRLMYGSEILKKDVLEYIVFEKHISNEYGLWRLHAKILPKVPLGRESMSKTFVVNQ